MKKIYYWGPFIDNKIATVSSIYNSVIGLNKFSYTKADNKDKDFMDIHKNFMKDLLAKMEKSV